LFEQNIVDNRIGYCLSKNGYSYNQTFFKFCFY